MNTNGNCFIRPVYSLRDGVIRRTVSVGHLTRSRISNYEGTILEIEYFSTVASYSIKLSPPELSFTRIIFEWELKFHEKTALSKLFCFFSHTLVVKFLFVLLLVMDALKMVGVHAP